MEDKFKQYLLNGVLFGAFGYCFINFGFFPFSEYLGEFSRKMIYSFQSDKNSPELPEQLKEEKRRKEINAMERRLLEKERFEPLDILLVQKKKR